jgi:hypothetical protein
VLQILGRQLDGDDVAEVDEIAEGPIEGGVARDPAPEINRILPRGTTC